MPTYCITKSSVNLKKLEKSLLHFKEKLDEKESELIGNDICNPFSYKHVDVVFIQMILNLVLFQKKLRRGY